GGGVPQWRRGGRNHCRVVGPSLWPVPPLPFVRKLVDGLDALRQGLEQRAAPTRRSKRRGLLVGLLVGLGKEGHGLVLRRHVLLNRNNELDVSAGFLLGHREKVQLGQS